MEKSQYKVMFEVENNHFWYQGMRKITKNLLKKFLRSQTDIKILDAGCGTGRNMLFLKKYGKVTGIDISDYAIKFCKKRGLKNVKVGSIDKLPFPDKSFDLVTCFDVLGQLEVKSDKQALSEFYRVLKPNGLLFMRIAAYNWLYGYHDRLVHTKHRYNTNEVRDLLTKTKFKLIKITYANCFLLPLVILRRIVKRFFIKRNQDDSDVKPVYPILNDVLKVPLSAESLIIPYLDLPFGLSVITVAKKKR